MKAIYWARAFWVSVVLFTWTFSAGWKLVGLAFLLVAGIFAGVFILRDAKEVRETQNEALETLKKIQQQFDEREK